ncbi:MAG TPA: ADP-forming succinate--CoA ligase subunit beta, partial [Pseudomonadota bacterium]|nr:ADP-forming succinate--CoA ligase subunit beta [Pseudomonadota bacterium]
MNIHEYQAKELLQKKGLPVPMGRAALSVEEAEQAAEWVRQQSGQPVVVVKAQIHAGGRGKGGGVKVTKTPEDTSAAIRKLYGMQLVTHQTGPDGKKVRRLLLEQGVDIAKEFYAAVVLDRKLGRLVLMVSTEGGMDIEEVAAHSPEKIFKAVIDPMVGFAPYQARQVAFALGLKAAGMAVVNNACTFFQTMVRAYLELDCSLFEVNPLVLTKQGQLIALDAKLNFDDNALYRHPEVEALRDTDEEEQAEIEAKKYDLSYVKLTGNIGCMVNGAGLAMSTMDIIRFYGSMPANFLDVGGGATAEKVTAAFKIITADPAVRGIFINIFGGIMKCDTIAQGVITAVKEVGLKVPLVVRLEGTNVELGKQILSESGLNVTAASDMADGAKKIVALAGQTA